MTGIDEQRDERFVGSDVRKVMRDNTWGLGERLVQWIYCLVSRS